MSATEIINVTVSASDTGTRLDKVLAAHAPQLSRARIQGLLDDGHVAPLKPASYRVREHEAFCITIPPLAEALPAAEDIALDIVYEDDHLLVINKPPGMVVHPGAGNREGTIVNALLAHCRGNLSGIGGVARPGIVHRLDKDTSGLMAVAKSDAAHQGLSAQLVARTLKRTYQAVAWGLPAASGRVETQIGRSKTNRQKMAVLTSGGKEAITDYKRLENYGRIASLVQCRLQTGRTHQIRVHMAHLQHWLVGDPVYGRPSIDKFLRLNSIDEVIATSLKEFPRQALHAASLEFIHPIGKNKVRLEAPLPDDMQKLLRILRKIK